MRQRYLGRGRAGRSRMVDEVVELYGYPPQGLPEKEKPAVIEYLKTL